MMDLALSHPNELARMAVKAYGRIQPYIRETPLLHSSWLSKVVQADVILKLESEQHTNSFKARGAINKVSGIP